jgi:type IV pilus assembly protein PilP
MSRSFVAFALLLGLSACGEPIPQNDAAAKPVAKAAPKPTLATVAPTEEYYYNPAGKRDPFQGFLQLQGPGDQESHADWPPLQRWDVDKYVLKGLIWDTESPRALLVDPDGLGHSVRLGTYVGRNWGKVSAITQDGIVVTEEYQNIEGDLVVNPVTVKFPEEVVKK